MAFFIVYFALLCYNQQAFHHTQRVNDDKLGDGDMNAKRMDLSYARMLVVDDNKTNLDIVKGLLGLYGIKADCTTSGQEAVGMLRSEAVKYDAVFMDLIMPEMDGLETTRIIREEIGTQYAMDIPIFALTANTVAGNEDMYLASGFQEVVSKPIAAGTLETILRLWVYDKNKEAELLRKEQN